MAIEAASTQRVTVPPAVAAGSATPSAPSPVKTAIAVDSNGMLVNNDGGPPVAEQDLSFWDVLDIVNPLQHIPLINRAYRALTGDEIKPSTQVIGDILYGGVIGGMASVANAVLEQETGKDATGHLLAAVGIGGDDRAPVMLAKSDSAGSSAASTPASPPASAAAGARAPASVAPAPVASTATPTARPTASAAPPPANSATSSAANSAKMPANTPSGAAGALSAAVANARPQQSPTPVDPVALAASGYHPSRMPARDAMLNTAMPPESVGAKRYSDTSRVPTGSQPPVAGRMTASAAPPKAAQPSAASSQAPSQAPSQSSGQPQARSAAGTVPANDGMPPQAVGRDAMANTMMQNLAKYRTMNTLTRSPATGTTVNTAS